jgi:hypothetical protein
MKNLVALRTFLFIFLGSYFFKTTVSSSELSKGLALLNILSTLLRKGAASFVGKDEKVMIPVFYLFSFCKMAFKVTG